MRDAELKKCQVLCSGCHQAKTTSEALVMVHGRPMYRKGCRCDTCRTIEVATVNENRRKRKSLASSVIGNTSRSEREDVLVRVQAGQRNKSMSRTTTGSGLDC